MDPLIPDTWPTGPEGVEQVGIMLGDEFGQMARRFITQRVSPAVDWMLANGATAADGAAAMQAMCDQIRGVADLFERQLREAAMLRGR